MVSVRAATPADRLAFSTVFGASDGLQWSTLDARTSRCLIAEDAEHGAVGFVEAQVAGSDVEILMIATRPDARRQGIATRLLAALIEHAEEAGESDRVILEVAEDNHPARQLYARHSFLEVARRSGYYRSRSDGTVRPEPCDALLLAIHFASPTSE